MSKVGKGLSTLLGSLFFLLLAGVGGAHAHAGLVGVDPADGSVLADAPEQVVFTFNEVLKDPSFLAVTINGGEVDGWTHVLEEEKLIAISPGGQQADGEYRISYRVVSSDGHPIDGTTTYTVGEPQEVDDPATDDTTTGNTTAPEDSDGRGADGLLESPWLWGAVVMVVALGVLTFLRRGRDDDA